MPRWNVERLITLVQERPVIWDSRSNDYSDRLKKDAAWEQVARSLRKNEWAKADSRGRADLLKLTKTRWASCRDQFRREVTKKGRSGEGTSGKRPYIYTAQLQFLRPVMDMRTTVDSLDPTEDSDSGGSESPAVFSPEPSPAPTPAEDVDDSTLAQAPLPLASPSRNPQPQPRRRRQVPPATSEQESRAAIDARLIEFLAQRRSDGVEDKMLRGLGPLLKLVSPNDQHQCLASLIVVLKMFTLPNHGDILAQLNNMRREIEDAAQPPPPDPFQFAPQHTQPPSFPPHHQYGLPQGQRQGVAQPLYPGSLPPCPPQQAQGRPRSSYPVGSFTQDLLNM
ncbi:uncharacterized protein LOC120991013 [Bufo bufo]|uniref:uncharacterized protein LOC120980926 n=1 Tax=Bufo bufo TaxID=8384 RepID=UPI001ABED48B|nr:uncharacterized protein LOC120980926 [Bufo bufo]XP_040266930.1 uncharacterized protein LOC120981456 [Bufo bufo]XP_040275837.1 uncharacterized protein LOC120991013 [Bufo bufo]